MYRKLQRQATASNDGDGKCLENQALLLLLASARQESGAGSVLEDLLDTVAGLGGTLEVLVGTNLLADILTLAQQSCQLARSRGG